MGKANTAVSRECKSIFVGCGASAVVRSPRRMQGVPAFLVGLPRARAQFFKSFFNILVDNKARPTLHLAHTQGPVEIGPASLVSYSHHHDSLVDLATAAAAPRVGGSPFFNIHPSPDSRSLFFLSIYKHIPPKHAHTNNRIHSFNHQPTNHKHSTHIIQNACHRPLRNHPRRPRHCRRCHHLHRAQQEQRLLRCLSRRRRH